MLPRKCVQVPQTSSRLSPGARRVRVDRRYSKLKRETESLAEPRRIAGKARADVVAALNIKQPSVSKIEKQADMYLPTLRDYAAAIGGKLELLVTLPERRPFAVRQLGDIVGSASEPKQSVPGRRRVAAP